LLPTFWVSSRGVGIKGRGEVGEDGRGEEVGCQGPPERLKSLEIPVSPESYYSPYLPQTINLILTSVLISLLNLSPNSLPNLLTYSIFSPYSLEALTVNPSFLKL
jgi:hypothetical protein